jgi:hypothetical protein
MNKVQLQALNDYLAESNSINLRMFALSVSPNPYKASELKNLIEKYRKDQTKLRLQAIEAYLGNAQKPKASKSKGPTPINYLPKVATDPKFEELVDLRKKYTANLKLAGSKKAAEENEILKAQIDALESELGLRFDYQNIPQSAVLESKQALVRSIFGDWQDPKSIAYEILNGSKPYFQMQSKNLSLLGGGQTRIIRDDRPNSTLTPSKMGVQELIGVLEDMAGQKARKFNIAISFRTDEGGQTHQVMTFNQNQMMNTF